MLLVAGCHVAPLAEMPVTTQPQCAMITFAPNDRIGAWSVDKFAGRYVNGTETLTVRRDDHRLFVDGWTLGTRQLTAESVESWTWRDGCGARYEFVLPPDGPGAWLKIITADGRNSDWRR
jgi:hypothetical protein